MLRNVPASSRFLLSVADNLNYADRAVMACCAGGPHSSMQTSYYSSRTSNGRQRVCTSCILVAGGV